MAGIERRIEALERGYGLDTRDAADREAERLEQLQRYVADFENALQRNAARVERGEVDLADLEGESPRTIACVVITWRVHNDPRAEEAGRILEKMLAYRSERFPEAAPALDGLRALVEHYSEALAQP